MTISSDRLDHVQATIPILRADLIADARALDETRPDQLGPALGAMLATIDTLAEWLGWVVEGLR